MGSGSHACKDDACSAHLLRGQGTQALQCLLSEHSACAHQPSWIHKAPRTSMPASHENAPVFAIIGATSHNGLPSFKYIRKTR